MQIKSLELHHFRNLEQEKLSFHPRFNLIIGQNAQGKTNIVEAIYYLAFLNSFRSSKKEELIKKSHNHASLHALIEKEGLDYEVNLLLEQRRRHLKLNGKKPHLIKDYYGLLPLLLFEPRDVYLFRDSPSQRRRYLHRALFLEKPSILQLIKDYDQVVSQKNRLLKEENSSSVESQLEIWNQKLAELGAGLIFERLEWIDQMNEILSQEYQSISNTKEEISLKYQSKIQLSESPTRQSLQSDLEEGLCLRSYDEKRRREALVGPHRDDWDFMIDDRCVGSLGSQGENRSAILALKSAQVHLFEKNHSYSPIFILDDVASELDQKRSEALFHYLRQTQGQVFLTTTQPDEIKGYFQGEGSSFIVESGRASML